MENKANQEEERIWIIKSGENNATFSGDSNQACQGFYTSSSESDFGLVIISENWGLNTSTCTTAYLLSKLLFSTIVPDINRGKINGGKDISMN